MLVQEVASPKLENTNQYVPEPHQIKPRRKDYYSLLPSIVKSSLATLLLTIAENEGHIEAQR